MKHNSQFRLAYLDGLRGIASLYVVLHHIFFTVLTIDSLPSKIITLSARLLEHGIIAVTMFIVLSGYCLMLPVVRSQRGYIPGSLWNYFQRRARRILPTYYAALILCLIISLIILIINKFTSLQWHKLGFDPFSPDFSIYDIVTHFLLIHNLTLGRDIYKINSPMWSIAVEWQIYWLFPLILLPLWRRWGNFALLAIAFTIGLTPHFLLRGYLDLSCPWLLGCFALGMVAADINFSQKPNIIKLQKSLQWGLLSIIFLSLAWLSHYKQLGLDEWICMVFAGFGTSCLIIYCTNSSITRQEFPLILRVLNSKAAIFLGSFSYSLYLTHAPILTLIRHGLVNLQLPSIPLAILLYLCCTIPCIIFAYLFHLLFERPFMTSSK